MLRVIVIWLSWQEMKATKQRQTFQANDILPAELHSIEFVQLHYVESV